MHSVFSEYEGAHCLALASRTEGFPKVVFEAMAHGLVCIVSKVGALPSIFEKDEIQFIEPGDSRMIADSLREFDSDRASAREKGLTLLDRASEFTLERLENKFAAILRDSWDPERRKYGQGVW